ncbi:vezatin [Rhinoraja longicauda]
MGEVFDEELVLENSPLYQYLHDVGHADFETCPSSPRVEERSPSELDIPVVPKRSFLSKLVDVIQKWNPFSETKRRKDLESLDMDFQLSALSTILEQEVLLQEDMELIELLDPSILRSTQAQQQRGGHQPARCLSGSPSIWDLSTLAAFASVFIVTSNLNDAFPWVMVGMFGLGLYLVCRGFGLWKRARLQQSMRKYSKCLSNLVTSSRAFNSLVRKSLRQIQEVEVISRGFMLVTAAYPASKLGSSRQLQGQQLIGLRKAVYNAVKSTYRASRLATCYLLKCYPLNAEIDNVTNYLCAIPLSELGLGLNEDALSDEEAQELTDGYSLGPLKILLQLCVGQSSEFFRRLILLLSPIQTAHKSRVSPGNLAHQIVAEVIDSLSHAVTVRLEELKRSYELHRYLQHQPNLKTPKRTSQQSSRLKNIYAVVRSLQLHLKVLLTEVITLEDHLEKLHESREQQEIMPDVYHDLDQKLKLIKPHVEATMGCWEEAGNLVDKLDKSSRGHKEGPGALDNNLLPASQSSEKTVVKIKDQDPVPEEQEFEAYVEESDSDGDFRSGAFSRSSPEEREKEKREREESRRVLQELKSVLGFKASELERQKWKQLLFNDQAALTALPPMNKALPEEEAVAPQDIGANDHQGCEEDWQQKDLGQLDTSPDGQECCSALACESTDDTTISDVTGIGDADGSSAHCSDPTDREQEDSPSPFCEPQQTAIRRRLAERHGPSSLHLTSALAVQAAARSLTFTCFQEQTFGDDDDSVDDDDNVDNDQGEDEREEQHDARNFRKGTTCKDTESLSSALGKPSL